MKWIIQSANSWISGKPTIEKIINENQHEGTIMVVERIDISHSPKPVKIFILGAKGNYGMVGDTVYFKKNGRTNLRGKCIIENIIQINESSINYFINEIGLNEKRPLWVFK